MTSLALPRFSQLACLLAVATTLVCPFAYAEDLFSDNIGHDYKLTDKSTELSADSTIGGYPIFRGGRVWRVTSGKSTLTSTRLTLGKIQMFSPTEHGRFALAVTTTNLNEAAVYYTAEPCKGSHLQAVNKGGGRSDNCLTIDAETLSVGSEQPLFLAINVRNSQNGGRFYNVALYLSLQDLGFPDAKASDWTEQSLTADPVKKEFITKLSAWAQKLQTGVNLAIGYDKPQDAFAAVPPLADVLALAPKTTP